MCSETLFIYSLRNISFHWCLFATLVFIGENKQALGSRIRTRGAQPTMCFNWSESATTRIPSNCTAPDSPPRVQELRPVPTLRRSEATASPNFLVNNNFHYKNDSHFFTLKENKIIPNSNILSTEKTLCSAAPASAAVLHSSTLYILRHDFDVLQVSQKVGLEDYAIQFVHDQYRVDKNVILDTHMTQKVIGKICPCKTMRN